MKTIGVFVDTCTVNRILDIDIVDTIDAIYEEDREYLTKIIEQFGGARTIRLFVNPAVKIEIEQTTDFNRKRALMHAFKQMHFTLFNTTVFPWVFPVTFLKDEEKDKLVIILDRFPSLQKDEKVLADAVFNSQIQVLLTTDRKHLANNELRDCLEREGLDEKIKVFSPKELYEYLLDLI